MSARSYTLITGASFGIGEAFAAALAARNTNLLLVARSTDRLETLRQRLLAAHPGIDIQCFTADLAAPGAVANLWSSLEAFTFDCVINNAGVGSGGDFAGLDLEHELEIVGLNIAPIVELTHRALPAMRARRAGSILNVASTAAFQPVPYMATYAASKAFVLNFSLALWRENRARGVHVMALCPGPTATRFFVAANIPPRGGRMQSSEQVVALALAGLRARRPVVVCGWRNRLMVAAARYAPRRLVLDTVARVMQSLGRGPGG